MERSVLSARTAMVAGGLVILVALFSLQEYFSRDWSGGPNSFDAMVFGQSIGIAVWTVLAFTAIRGIERRFPLRGGRSVPTILIHGASALTISVAQTSIVSILFASYYYGFSRVAIWDVFSDRMHKNYFAGVLVYLLVATVISFMKSGQAPPAEIEVDELGPDRYARRILVRADGRSAVLPVSEIDWIEADDNNLIIHAGRAAHTIRGPLARVAARLDPANFARVHRSTVLNLERVHEVQPWFHGDMVAVLKDKTRVTIGRTFRDPFLAALEG